MRATRLRVHEGDDGVVRPLELAHAGSVLVDLDEQRLVLVVVEHLRCVDDLIVMISVKR